MSDGLMLLPLLLLLPLFFIRTQKSISFAKVLTAILKKPNM